MFERGSTHLIEKDEVEIWTAEKRVIGPLGPVHKDCTEDPYPDSIVIGSYPALGHYDHVRPRRCCWCRRWVSQGVEEWLDNVVCPECDSEVIEEQTKGYFKLDPPHDHNPNLCTCYGCGHKWYRPCPECGAINNV